MDAFPEWLLMQPHQALYIAASVVGAYVAVIILTRLSGIRSFSKMSGFDFAVTVAIGSIFASIVMGKTPSLIQGIVALSLLFACQIFFATLRQRISFMEALSDNSPRLIMIGREIQTDQLAKARMTKADLMAKLREANVANFSQIKIVIAETTGDVSVIHHAQDIELSEELLAGVIGADRL